MGETSAEFMSHFITPELLAKSLSEKVGHSVSCRHIPVPIGVGTLVWNKSVKKLHLFQRWHLDFNTYVAHIPHTLATLEYDRGRPLGITLDSVLPCDPKDVHHLYDMSEHMKRIRAWLHENTKGYDKETHTRMLQEREQTSLRYLYEDITLIINRGLEAHGAAAGSRIRVQVYAHKNTDYGNPSKEYAVVRNDSNKNNPIIAIPTRVLVAEEILKRALGDNRYAFNGQRVASGNPI